MRGLHSSDSGADLSEYSHQDTTTTYEQEFQKYWSENSEQIIWKSWINKYKAYINPEYMVKCSTTTQPQDAGQKTQEDADRSLEVTQRNQMLIRNLSGSDSYDKLNNVQADGWNQLSPTSNEFEQENERLLSSRCGSVASSTAKTFATTDSMTNVTCMTASSIDLSDSSKSSDSLSSPISSIESSAQSSSDDPDETMDSDQYWQILWQKHYEEQYSENYKKFMLSRQVHIPFKENSPIKTSRRHRYSQKSDHETHVSNLMETLAVEDQENETNDIRYYFLFF